MQNYFLKSGYVAMLLLLNNFLSAQKTIIINDSLLTNADQYNVKLGGQAWGKLWKIQFADYTIVSSKLGGETTTTKSNFWGTKSTSDVKQKFLFVMSNGASDTASVEAAKFESTKTTQELQLSKHVALGSNEVKQWKLNFTAFITVNDTTDTWLLLMNASAQIDSGSMSEAYLLKDERKIMLFPVTSQKNKDDKQMLPALGYEFIENGHSLCALQYYGGGLLGRNKVFIWMDKRLDAKTKLLLATAMTTVLQLKEMQL